MYEETDKKFFTKDLIILILKLLFLIIFIFIICWLFLRTNKDNKITEVDSDYVNNINMMKTAAFEYFTKEKLPAKVGQNVKVTLEDMLNQKLLIDFTNNGKTCNLQESYIQATKTADENYALKVNLNCNKKDDYIVTTIETKDIVCQTCNNQSNNNTNTNNNVSVNENKTDKTENKTENKEETSKTSTSTTTNKNTTTTNKKPVQVTTKVITKVTYKFTYHKLCSSCDSPQKETYYEIIKYGNWQNGENYNSGYETKCSNVDTYNYCQVKKVNYYANCTAPVNNINNYRGFSLQIPYSEDNKPFYISSSHYTSINDYKTYLDAKKKNPLDTSDKFSQNFPDMDANTMMTSALKDNNFSILNATPTYYQGKLYIRYNVSLNNFDNVKPYFATKLGYNVYFIPVKITIGYDIKNTCVVDTLENAYKYPDYHQTYVGKGKACTYRQVTKKWVSEKDLNNYLNQGWSKTGNTKIK